MVHTRINERVVNPNSQINFICALPSPRSAHGSGEDQEAKEMLCALAAQLKPVMNQHGFTVNSFEEYENNKVFLGRNWNNGETIELVLRDANGSFYPASTLLGVFCHELAHIQHMNHSDAFHALRRQLSSEVTALQRQGYYGDGFWSAGFRLSDLRYISGKGAKAQEFPEYTCGGAHSQSRSSALPSRRRRRDRRIPGPSLSSGAQSAKRRKAGSRVTSKTAFEAAGEGSVLDQHVEKGGKGSGFRKQAGSQRAREERALAAERRLGMIHGTAQDPPDQTEFDMDSENEEGLEHASETDGDRLKRMRDVMGTDDLAAMRDEAYDDIVVVCDSRPVSTGSHDSTRQMRDKDKPLSNEESRELVEIGGSVKRRPVEVDGPDNAPFNKRRREDRQGTSENSALRSSSSAQGILQGPSEYLHATGRSAFATSSSSQPLLPNSIFKQEISQRKREALGMDRPKTLGNSTPTFKASEREWTCDMCTFANTPDRQSCMVCERPRRNGRHELQEQWSCSACTFDNQWMDSKCAVCEHPKS